MPKPQLCARSPPPAGASRSLRPTIYDTTRARDDRKVCRARARGVAPSSRASSRVASLVMMHPRVRHKHVDYRTGEVSLTTSKREARELVYFTRGRDGRAPFSFQTDYVPVMSVCCERVRVCVMGRASPAMYPLAYCFAGVSPPRNPFSKNSNWTF